MTAYETRSLTLYHHPSSPNCIKVRAVALELGVELELTPVNVFKGEAQAARFRALNPNGLVPVLVDGDFVLWESNAILSYLADLASSFAPASARERADVARWLHWESAHLAHAARKVAFERVVKPAANQGAIDEAAATMAAAAFVACVRVLEATLSRQGYLAERLSVADFAIACLLSSARAVGLEVSGFPKTQSWLARMLARESLRRALAESRLFTAATYDPTDDSPRH